MQSIVIGMVVRSISPPESYSIGTKKLPSISLKSSRGSAFNSSEFRMDSTTYTTFTGMGISITKNTIKNFSGGEKARLALSIIAFQKPNLLLMDEPTNHLDMDMRQALTVALQRFRG